jgi:hypothetical protein
MVRSRAEGSALWRVVRRSAAGRRNSKSDLANHLNLSPHEMGNGSALRS